jgi:hypothetical protein
MSEYGDIVIVSEKLDSDMNMRNCSLRSKHFLNIKEKTLSPDDVNNMLTLGVMTYLLATENNRFYVSDEDEDVIALVKKLKEIKKGA